MNLVIDEAVEVKLVSKTNDKETRRSLGASRARGPRRTASNRLVGQILLKGDNVSLIQSLQG